MQTLPNAGFSSLGQVTHERRFHVSIGAVPIASLIQKNPGLCLIFTCLKAPVVSVLVSSIPLSLHPEALQDEIRFLALLLNDSNFDGPLVSVGDGGGNWGSCGVVGDADGEMEVSWASSLLTKLPSIIL